MIYSIAETAKANKLKPYEYFNYLLEVIPEHMDDIDRAFLEDLLPWSDKLPDNIRKPQKSSTSCESSFKKSRYLVCSIYL